MLFLCSHRGLPSSRAAPLHLQPGIIHGRRHGSADGGRADVPDDAEGLPQGVVHPQHLVAVLRLLLRLLHQRVLVAARVKLGQQLRVDELLRLDRMRRFGREVELSGFISEIGVAFNSDTCCNPH